MYWGLIKKSNILLAKPPRLGGVGDITAPNDSREGGGGILNPRGPVTDIGLGGKTSRGGRKSGETKLKGLIAQIKKNPRIKSWWQMPIEAAEKIKKA